MRLLSLALLAATPALCSAQSPQLLAYWSLNATTEGNAGEAGPFNTFATDLGLQAGSTQLNVTSGSQFWIGTNYGSSVNATGGFGSGAGLIMRKRSEGYTLTFSGLDFSEWTGVEISYSLNATSSSNHAHVIEYNLSDGGGWQTVVPSQTYSTGGTSLVSHALTALDDTSNVTLRIRVTSQVDTASSTRIDNIQINAVTRVNESPQVSLLSPVDGWLITTGSTVLLEAEATDDRSVVSVEFFANDQLIGVDTNGSDGWSLDWIPSQAGLVTVKAKATDNEPGTPLSSETSVQVTVGNENYAPDIALTSPPDGTTVLAGTSVVVSAAGYDSQGIAQIEFFANGTSIGIDSNPGDGWSVDFQPTVAGSYTLVAVATDTLGLAGSSSGTVLTVGAVILSPPSAVLSLDQTEGYTPLRVTLDASASSDLGGNNSGIVAYHWDIDGDGLDDTTTTSPQLEYAYQRSGSFMPSVTVEDLDGQVDTATAEVNVTPKDIVSYLAPGQRSSLTGGHVLSDGTLLVGGASNDLNWVPVGTPMTLAGNPGNVLSASGNQVGYILHLSADLSAILHVWHLPPGAVSNIQRLRTTNIPGDTTGALYISGVMSGGYYVGRLDNNFLNGVPSGFEWVHPVSADTDHFEAQAWDVSSDGTLVYQFGTATGVGVRFRDAFGNPKLMPQLRASHWANGSWTDGIGSEVESAEFSQISLPSGMTSWTESDRTAVTPDGNADVRMGTWPLDIFITEKLDGSGDAVRTVGPVGDGGINGNNQNNGPGSSRNWGYTGYRSSGRHWIETITVDRRNGDFYIGVHSKSEFYGYWDNRWGNVPDFEPSVVAYNGDGSLKWWTRLYHEWQDRNGNGIVDIVNEPLNGANETNISWPDQYVDSLEVDYSTANPADGSLVVLARTHGNAPENFWEGNTVAANPGARGFQNQFTGTESNIHISWLGKFTLSTGTLEASSYVTGFFRFDGGNYPNGTYSEPNLEGWPNINSGWANVTTTRIRENTMRVDDAGRVYLIGRGPRMVTTSEAYLKHPRRVGNGINEGNASWAQYARVYTSDLTNLNYSTILTGEWEYPNGNIFENPTGADNTTLTAVIPVRDGFVVTGYHQSDKNNSSLAKGNPVLLADRTDWGADSPSGQTAMIARFSLTSPRLFAGYDQNWKDYAFAGHPMGTSGPHTDRTADANGTGGPNILDFALQARSMDPLDVSGKQPRARLHDLNGVQYLEFDFRRIRGGLGDTASTAGYEASNVVYRVQYSETLSPDNWRTVATELQEVAFSDNEDGTETVTVRVLDDTLSAGRGFVRLSIEEDAN